MHGLLKADLLVRRAILESWQSLPEEERDYATLEQKFLHLVDLALEDAKTNLGSAAPASKAEPDYGERMARVKAVYPRAYQPWMPDEEQELLKHRESGLSVDAIAKILKRQPGAIRSRLEKLE